MTTDDPGRRARELGHLPYGLEDDAARHLRPAGAALCEDDRNLDDLGAGPEGAVGRLDLEGVALRPESERAAALRRPRGAST